MIRQSPSDTVRARAGNRCEYCRLPQFAHVLTFPIDHVIAKQHGGEDDLDNLALSCVRCNSYKGPNIAGIDPISRELTRLFHPRRDTWIAHFLVDGPKLVGITNVGRVTIELLQMNHPDYLALRASLLQEGVRW